MVAKAAIRPMGQSAVLEARDAKELEECFIEVSYFFLQKGVADYWRESYVPEKGQVNERGGVGGRSRALLL